jgi:hypothetical protein
VTEYCEAKATAKNAKEDAEVAKAKLFTAIGTAERVIGSGWKISASMVADTPATLITAEMVGKTYGGRAGYRNLLITTTAKKK